MTYVLSWVALFYLTQSTHLSKSSQHYISNNHFCLTIDSISAGNVVPCQVNEIFGPEVNFANLSMDDFDEDAYLERLNRIEG